MNLTANPIRFPRHSHMEYDLRLSGLSEIKHGVVGSEARSVMAAVRDWLTSGMTL
jgi:hypothetical protein